MKYTIKFLILTLLFFTLFKPTKLVAQNPILWYKDWSVSGELGLSYFFGDVNDNHNRISNNTPLSSFYWDNKEFMSSITLAKQMDRFWGVRLHLLYGNLAGTNDNIRVSFNGKVFESDIDVTFNFIDMIFKRPEKTKFKYYAFVGLGISKYRAVSSVMNTGKFINQVGYQDSGRFVSKLNTDALMSFGLGIKYNLNKQCFFTFETSLRYINTDILDAYSSSSSKVEGFGFMSIGFGYKFDFRIWKGSNGDSWQKSKGKKNDPRNSGMNNNKKTRLRNKWK